MRVCLPARLSFMQGGSIAVVRGGDTIAILEAELKQVVRACLITVGATSDNADAVADVLVAADMRGVPSHGVNRLEMYIAEIENGVVDPVAQPSIAVDGEICTSSARVHDRLRTSRRTPLGTR